MLQHVINGLPLSLRRNRLVFEWHSRRMTKGYNHIRIPLQEALSGAQHMYVQFLLRTAHLVSYGSLTQTSTQVCAVTSEGSTLGQLA